MTRPTSEDILPLDAELRALLDRERGSEDDDPAHDDSEEVLERVERTVRLAGARRGRVTASRLLGLSLLAGIGALALVYASRTTAPRHANQTVPVAPSASPPPMPVAEMPSIAIGDLPTATVARPVSVTPETKPSPVLVTPAETKPRPVPVTPAEMKPHRPTEAAPAVKKGPTLAVEYALIESARAGMARHDWTAALSAVASHEHEFPSGELVQERESLRVQALARSGERERARLAAARFRERFPDGLLLPIVEQTIREMN